jgi:hypothetical protein
MIGRRIIYSGAEMAWLEANKAMVISDYRDAFVAEFRRDDVSLINLHSLRKRKGWKTGRTGHFAKGQSPMNKGKKCAPGTGGRHPNAQATQFKKGQRSGVAVKLWKPIGTERVTVDGYIERKVNNDMPIQARWKQVHRINWELVNGPIHEGFVLKCLDGNHGNTEADNWEAVHRGVLARLNGGRFRKTLPYDAAPEELKPLVMASAKLKHALHERLKNKA